MRFTAGQTIGRYVIESLLGEGGMGEVYRARDSKLERAVAVKVLRNDTEGATEDWEHAVMRMQREAQAVAALSHPGIVAIYDIGEHEGAPFIAMELVGGQPLRNLIGKDLPFTTRLRIMLDVARALGAAHEAGFVHRDIKPENILVRQDGVTKILDFGIARRTSRNVDHSAQTLDIQGATIDAALVGMTADGALVGTPAYMSPEQLRGEIADARADQFAWGVVAYELFSGKHPFHAEKGAIGLLAAILGETPAALEDVPEGITAAVMRALEKDPDKRWLSMQEIVTHCEAFSTGGDKRILPDEPRQEGIVSPSQTGPNKTTTLRASRARWVIAPIVAVAALTAVVAFAFRGRPGPQITLVVAASATPTATATTVMDLRIPASASTAAIAEFRQGLQNIRDAQWTAAARAFNHAREADPGMAAAHMRYSMIQYSYDITSAREAYRKAMALRASLSERDQGFLLALEPVFLREPGDYGEAAKRLEPHLAKYPKDAELTFWLSRLLYYRDFAPETSQRVVELNTRCTELDPQYADCWQTKAQGLTRLGKHEEAGKALDECMRVSENSVDCLLDAIENESQLGHCETVVEMARRLKTKDPHALHSTMVLGESLYYSGASEAVVRAAFEDAEKRSDEGGRHFEARKASFLLATSYGDFAKALEIANSMAQSMNIPSMETESELWAVRTALYTEVGNSVEAAALADQFFVARALHPELGTKKFFDSAVTMHALRLRAGKITLAEFQKLRAEWIAKQPPTRPLRDAFIWFSAYAAPAYSADLAKEALTNVPREFLESVKDMQPLARPFNLCYSRLLYLAGRYVEAIPRLENTLQVCTSDESTLWNTQYHALLGYAREESGNKSGACEEYDRVLSRWGKSKQSVTAKEVTKRAKKLGCGSTAGQ